MTTATGGRAVRRQWAIIPAIVLTAAWLTVTHLPKPERIGIHVGPLDWLAHGAGYLTMAACWLAWASSRPRTAIMRAAVVVWLAMLVLGAADEITQPLVSRACSLTDWLSDAVGAALGATILWLTVQRRARTHRTRTH